MEFCGVRAMQAVAEALGAYSRLSQLERLRDRFEFKDPAGRDQGINVRQRAGAIVVLLNDREKLKDERDKVRAIVAAVGAVRYRQQQQEQQQWPQQQQE
jgi:hypothetical protein